jgi:hypothetical protein
MNDRISQRDPDEEMRNPRMDRSRLQPYHSTDISTVVGWRSFGHRDLATVALDSHADATGCCHSWDSQSTA